MRILVFLFRLLPILMVGVVLHYVLPQHDIVRVVNTYQERQDLNDWTRIFWSDPSPHSATLVNRETPLSLPDPCLRIAGASISQRYSGGDGATPVP